MIIYNLPILPLCGIIVFPGVQIHFDVERKESISSIKEALNREQMVYLVSQKDPSVEKPGINDIYSYGTLAKVSHFLKISENTYRVVVTCMYRVKCIDTKKFKNFMVASIMTNDIDMQKPEDILLYRNFREKVYSYFTLNNVNVPEVVANSFDKQRPLEVLCNNICSNFLVEYHEQQELLEISDIRQLIHRMLEFLDREIKISEIESEINGKVKQKLDKHQREYYLNEQLKTIKNELGDKNEVDDICEEYYNRIISLSLPDAYEKKLIKELSKLDNLNPNNSEFGVITSYLDLVLELPWNRFSEDNLDIENAKNVLNENHFGLEEVKERIVEYIAVKNLGGVGNGNIICLSGPPGVGKTTIAESLAEALNRRYVRISLGGLKDESEIRGHRKTYVGAMPGRIINAFKQAECQNPLILLDEIDKVSSDYKGDPSSALLEVLDNGQNKEFKDNYVEIPFDISNAIFIATANDINSIPGPLIDRMDIISIPGYTFEEKIQITKRHLIPDEIAKHALKNVSITDGAIEKIISSYTRESGVRSLDRNIQKLCRKCAVKIVSGTQKTVKITENNLTKYLGTEIYTESNSIKISKAGVVTGLAWTQYGGDVLTIEATLIEGKGKLQLTGNLGDVMKESAQIALSYVKANCKLFNISIELFDKFDVHIHIPEGAVPKDGPSAGITLATAIVSAFSGKLFKNNCAMTGELTLTGRVLAVGGLREKSLAALQNGIKTIFISSENKRNVSDLSETVKDNIKFIAVDDVRDIINKVLV